MDWGTQLLILGRRTFDAAELNLVGTRTLSSIKLSFILHLSLLFRLLSAVHLWWVVSALWIYLRVATCLWSPLDLLLSLVLWIDLELLASFNAVHSIPLVLWCITSLSWIVYHRVSYTCCSLNFLGRSWSNPSWRLRCSPLLLLLGNHLLLYLLFVQLLSWRQVEVVNDVRDISDAVWILNLNCRARSWCIRRLNWFVSFIISISFDVLPIFLLWLNECDRLIFPMFSRVVLLLHPSINHGLLNLEVFWVSAFLWLCNLCISIHCLILRSICGVCYLTILFNSWTLWLSAFFFLLLRILFLHFKWLLVLKIDHLLLFFEFMLLSVLLLDQRCTNLFGPDKVYCIVFNDSRDSFPAVVDLWQLDEQRNKVEQLSIFRVVVPRDNRYSAFWLKHVRTRRVVKDYRILHVPSNFAHVFGEHAINISAVLSEETHRAIPIQVHLIHEWISILREWSCENYQFVILRHYFQKIVDARSLLDEDVADVAVNVHWNNVVRVLYLVELAVHQCFIQIQHKSFHSSILFWRRPKHSVSFLCYFWSRSSGWQFGALRFWSHLARAVVIDWYGIQLTLWNLSNHCFQFVLKV